MHQYYSNTPNPTVINCLYKAITNCSLKEATIPLGLFSIVQCQVFAGLQRIHLLYLSQKLCYFYLHSRLGLVSFVCSNEHTFGNKSHSLIHFHYRLIQKLWLFDLQVKYSWSGLISCVWLTQVTSIRLTNL